jgi:MoxR-like ATPase
MAEDSENGVTAAPRKYDNVILYNVEHPWPHEEEPPKPFSIKTANEVRQMLESTRDFSAPLKDEERLTNYNGYVDAEDEEKQMFRIFAKIQQGKLSQ